MNQKIAALMTALRDEIEASYIAKGLLASGNFGKELTVNTIGTNHMTITAPHYVVQMELGRRVGKRPPVSAIKRWIKAKNANAGTSIPEEAAFAIAFVIGRDGIKVPNVYNSGGVVREVINDKRLAEIGKTVEEVLRFEINKILTV